MNGKWRWIFLAAIYAVLLGGGLLVGDRLLEFLDFDVRPANEPTVHMTIMTVAAIFVLASALPFVPGAEIGFGLILVFGGRIALLVYLCMVAALSISYLIGRFVPIAIIGRFFKLLGMERAHNLVMQFAPLDSRERLELLVSRAPRRFVPALLRHRYVALAVLLNMPGNSLVGGGGGLAFTAGLSGLFSLFGFLVAIALAVAPVPLFFYLFG
ncbi:MAG: hypothetical protein NXI27_11360 [Alphaproteobacteria bacterium]|nr:hypothetical protein [Alphaproteobacteria bacterium]